ncbi:uncharacterized protein LOC135483122 [Lineus longissimus]|uniref:uncharacterized protein LOC135483122 n=1 Tax=Lineus longissimus TaxID=88925 RepID=UPI00315CCBDF
MSSEESSENMQKSTHWAVVPGTSGINLEDKVEKGGICPVYSAKSALTEYKIPKTKTREDKPAKNANHGGRDADDVRNVHSAQDTDSSGEVRGFSDELSGLTDGECDDSMFRGLDDPSDGHEAMDTAGYVSQTLDQVHMPSRSRSDSYSGSEDRSPPSSSSDDHGDSSESSSDHDARSRPKKRRRHSHRHHRGSRDRARSRSGSRSKSRRKRLDKKGSFKRFDPCEDTKKTEWSLSEDQESFLETHFTTLHKDEVLKENVLKTTPVPTNQILKVPKLEEQMLELLPFKIRDSVQHADASLAKVMLRVTQVMGPLGKAWRRIEKARKHPDKPMGVNELMELLEKGFLLLRQAFVWGNYVRRTQFLTRFLTSHKRAAHIVKENGELLSKNRSKLFGKKFFEKLHTKAKGTKKAKEIRLGLNSVSGFKRGRSNNRPFQNGPSSSRTDGGDQRNTDYQYKARGTATSSGNARRGRGRGTKTRGQKRYVTIKVSSLIGAKPATTFRAIR